ncbi:MAG TPA: hypothetical protein VMT63_09620 [Bacteroidales bacterium]|nr:hypothetical protein [Bacteroidales bacterium]
MKKLLSLLILPVLMISSLSGQEKPRERLEAYKIAFFTKKLELTSQEASRFWPIYNEFQEKKNQIQLEKMRINRDFNQNGLNMTDKEMTDAGDKFIALEMQSSSLALEYHKKFKEILPPVKVLKLYQAENQYRIQLLQELKQNGPVRNNIRKGLGAGQDEI